MTRRIGRTRWVSSYTAYDMRSFARDLGYDGEPFTWDDEERRHLRARLDALYFHLYGLSREDAGYVMNTFPMVRRQDESAFREIPDPRHGAGIHERAVGGGCGDGGGGMIFARTSTMEIQYDRESDMLYIGLLKHTSTESEEIAPGFVVDYDEANRIVGIEIEGGTAMADLTKLDVSGLPLADLVLTGHNTRQAIGD